MKTFIFTALMITATYSFADTTPEFQEAQELYESARTPSKEELQLGKEWACKLDLIENDEMGIDDLEMNEDDLGYFIFKKSGKKIKDLNSKNNGFKKYKFKKGELVSKKRLFIGASLTNTIRVSGDSLITEVKIAGLIGKALVANEKSPVLGYMTCK